MSKSFNKTCYCQDICEEVMISGYWYVHESVMNGYPEPDLQTIRTFVCDKISKCKFEENNCPVRKKIQENANSMLKK